MVGAPAYARGSMARDIMDVLRDAPDRKMPRASLARAVAKRRGKAPAEVRNSLAQALLRMFRKGDVDRVSRGVYLLTCQPVPDRYDSANAWRSSRPEAP